MLRPRSILGPAPFLFATLMVLSGCSALDKNVWPLFAGSDESAATTSTATASTGTVASSSASNASPVLRAPGSSAPADRPGLSVANGLAERRPLVIIRFERPDPNFDRPLYDAVSLALQRKPDAVFDIVAMAPPPATVQKLRDNQNAQRRNMQSVLRSLTEMGLPEDRVTLSATTSAAAGTDEIRLYVR